jgi:hypothetical protein
MVQEVNAFLDEMKKERADQMASVNYFFKNSDEIQKGLASDLSYNEEFSKLEIKGSEIKSKLIEYKNQLLSCISDCSMEMGKIKQEIGSEPEMEREEYDGFKSGLKMYDSKGIYSKDSEPDEKKMKYNNLIYRLCDKKRELKLTDTLISSIKDEKNYKLPVRVASILGF